MQRSVRIIAEVCAHHFRGLCAALQRFVYNNAEVCVHHCRGLRHPRAMHTLIIC